MTKSATAQVMDGTPKGQRGWRKQHCAVKEADLRISRDAGMFVCEYITYGSLSYLHYHKNNSLPLEERTGIIFLHAPAEGDEAAVRQGKEVYLALIKALVVGRLEAWENRR